MGLTLGFNYKNIDFNLSSFASLGNDLVRDYERKNLYSNKGSYVVDSWTPTNPSNLIPRPVNGASVSFDNFSDYFVEDASYLRIQNIQIGYTFDKSLAQKFAMKNCRVYLSLTIYSLLPTTKVMILQQLVEEPMEKANPLVQELIKGFIRLPKHF